MKLVTPVKNRGLQQILKIAIIFWLGEILVIFFSWSFLPPQLPLFYSHPWGKEQLATPSHLFILPALGLIIFFINSVLLFFTPKQETLIKQILITTILVFNFLSLFTLIKIVRLVI